MYVYFNSRSSEKQCGGALDDGTAPLGGKRGLLVEGPVGVTALGKASSSSTKRTYYFKLLSLALLQCGPLPLFPRPPWPPCRS